MQNNIFDDEVNLTADIKRRYSKLDIFFIFLTILYSLSAIFGLIFLLYNIWPISNFDVTIPKSIKINDKIIEKINPDAHKIIIENYDTSSDKRILKNELSTDAVIKLHNIFKDVGYYQNEIEKRYFLIVLICGAIGSLIFGLRSLSKHIGLLDFEMSWLLSYFIKPFLGGSVALIFYFVFKGGILSASAGIEHINIYGVAAISGIVGMFTEQAIHKLKEIFDNLFTKVQTEKKITLNLPDEIKIDDKDYNLNAFDQLSDEEKKIFHGFYTLDSDKDIYILTNKDADIDTKRILLSIINKIRI